MSLSLRICLAAFLALAACKHVPTEKEKQGAQIHFDLGVQAQQNGSIQEAYSEFEKSLQMDPDFAESHNAMAILLHLSFRKLEDAIEHYRRAIEVRPTYSEAKTNLANVYLDQERYDEAIALYAEALNDMLYPTPFIAQGNMGWAYYKKGETARAIESIKSALTTHPQFCLGYKNLGIIYDETGDPTEACVQFGRYREACPEHADTYLREGVCQAKTGQTEAAKASFALCEEKASARAMKDDCRKLRERL